MLSHELPEDLMNEIIVRLPVKSLLRFKCVAKSWYALITDSCFIAEHLERSRSISKSRRLKLIFQLDRFTRVPYISLISKDQPYVLHDIEPLPHKEYWGFYGQCDGIFCLHVININEEGDNEHKRKFWDPKKKGSSPDKGNLILWNPATKEDKLIPVSQCLLPKGIDSDMFGFGFDPITKDYKIVQVSDWPLEGGEHLVEVYNLSTDSWRVLDVFVPDFEICFGGCTSYLNGVYYWLVFGLNGITRSSILSFDFGKEVFRMMQLPPAIDSLHGPIDVFVLDQSLAFAIHSCATRKSKVWVMNEHGVESSWTEKFEIGPLDEFGSILGSWRDNEILIDTFDGQVISYNLQNQHIYIHAPKMSYGFAMWIVWFV
ncbi:F-box/kelch-repeat protein At3g06240-like [Neltuma alba]|uniref:F-box/kelch-repeat protein At3g06240-like n=1 Tax=Neltuma alba TaxID=207710 RepID=UPI0010A312F4|nr:F-box/kelch-repeat protein At3g06240-like [Prosopis alba]